MRDEKHKSNKMPKQPALKGFNPEEIVDWYKFYIKTKSIDKLVENKRPDDTKINELFPKLSNWKVIVDFESMSVLARLKDLSTSKSNQEDGFYFANTRNSALKSLIAHLRDSFMTGNIYKCNRVLRVEKEAETQSIYGVFDWKKIKSFLKLFID